MIRSKIGYKSGGPKIQKALNVEIEEEVFRNSLKRYPLSVYEEIMERITDLSPQIQISS